MAGLKDELYSKLREKGYEDLIHETINANSLSSFVKEQIAENDNLLPEWLEGLVNVYERNTVGVRRQSAATNSRKSSTGTVSAMSRKKNGAN